MRAISLWQPWASLWANGRKIYETRHWSTDYRGPLLIHAAQTIALEIDPALREIIEEEFGPHWRQDLPRGALIARCDLAACLPTSTVHVDADELLQGNFQRGRYAWRADNPTLLPRPIPYRGQQGFFTVPDELLGRIHPAAALLRQQGLF